MNDYYLLSAPILLLGVIALLGFVGCFTKPPRPEAAQTFIIDQVPGDVRTANSWFGMTIHVQSNPLTVRALGRYFVDGNSMTHRMRIVDAMSLEDVPGSMANVDMSAPNDDPDDPYRWGSLSTPYPVLKADTIYHILSEEKNPGDAFRDQNTTVTPVREDASVDSGVQSDNPGVFQAVGGAEHAFGPVNFRYVVDL
ncbi:MAG TPA: hypothetical protein VNC11_16560 [Gemmatimonadaceae bacterium]|nr:hypothetical protein [Gemmatimonadaceae bacterium]